MKSSTLYNDYPICVYDVALQKCFAVFKSKRKASLYCFGKDTIINTKSLLAQRKYPDRKNVFDIEITFRSATKEQEQFLGENEYHFIFKQYEVKEQADKVQTKYWSSLHKESIQNSGSHHQSKSKSLELRERACAYMDEGYTPEEISKMLDVPESSIYNNYAKNKLHLNDKFTDYRLKDLEQFANMIDNRIDRIKNRK